MSSVPAVQVSHVFGCNPSVTGNIAYQDDSTVVYPAGSLCVLYNVAKEKQRIIYASDGSNGGFTAMAVTPNRRYVALAEKSERPPITVFDLYSLKKRKILTNQEMRSNQFVSLTFSPDSKYLAAQGGAPDWTLVLWIWEKSRTVAFTSISLQADITVKQVRFNPHDNTQLSVVGDGVFRMLHYSEGSLKQLVFLKFEAQHYCSHAWNLDETVFAGNDQGVVQCLDNGDLKMEIDVFTQAKPTTPVSAKVDENANVRDRRLSSTPRARKSSITRERKPSTTTTTDSAIVPTVVTKSDKYVTCVSIYSKGFICACGARTVSVFERSESGYARVKQIQINVEGTLSSEEDHQFVTEICVSPSEENIVCTTNIGQIYTAPLLTAGEKGSKSKKARELSDLSHLLDKQSEDVEFSLLSQQFHYETITGLDICVRKPLIATSSSDGTVRVWNYLECSEEIVKVFGEHAYSVALHPTGLFILLGFRNKLILANILIDDVKPFKEFQIKNCKECAFSHGGHMFAATELDVIYVHSSVTFARSHSLRGHNGKVRALQWSRDDSKIISCGSDGAVYEWDTFTGNRVNDCVQKDCSYSSVSIASDNKTVYAVGSDRKLKQILESEVIREYKMEADMSCVVISHASRMLFGTTNSGALRVFKFPLSDDYEWVDFQGHGANITKAKITFDDQFLITVSEDSCVMLWKLTEKQIVGIAREKEVAWSQEILVTRNELLEKNTSIDELTSRISEIQTENEYQLRLKDITYNEKIKELIEKSSGEIENLKTKNQVLTAEKLKSAQQHEEDCAEIINSHHLEMEEIESTCNQKLMIEYDKYQQLQLKSQQMQENYEKELQELESTREQALEQHTKFYSERIKEKDAQLKELRDKILEGQHEHGEKEKQIEFDYDTELLSIKNKYEKELWDEKEQSMKLKSEAGVLRKKQTTLIRDVHDQKKENEKLVTEANKLSKLIQNLERDILELKREIAERDETVQDKEKRIYDLKKKTQELEKFKFVLDYKNIGLKKQLEPKEEDLKNMQAQIESMEKELERFNKTNTQLELNISELKLKLKTAERTQLKERRRARDAEALITRFKTDLHNVVAFIQDTKQLKDSIVSLYKKHVAEDISETATMDADIQKEYERHKHHLERTVTSLRQKLVKDSRTHKGDNIRIMTENVSLIKEINLLRKELKVSRAQVHDLQTMLNLHRKQAGMDVGNTTELLVAVRSGNPNVVMREDLKESERVIEEQRQDLQRLRLSTRPISAVTLPMEQDVVKEELTECRKVIELQQKELRRLRSAPPTRPKVRPSLKLRPLSGTNIQYRR